MITVSQLRDALDYCPDTGLFKWRISRGFVRAGSVAGTARKDGYFHIGVYRRNYLSHRLAWMHVHGEYPSSEVDHINRNRGDNRISNLRLVTRSENAQNGSDRKNNTSGYRGVTFNRANSVWIAQITKDTKCIYLGSFTSAEDAHQAYLSAAKHFHKCSAALNPSFIQQRAAA